MKITYYWRRSADPRPILFLDIIIETKEGWSMQSFPAYSLLADMAPELTR